MQKLRNYILEAASGNKMLYFYDNPRLAEPIPLTGYAQPMKNDVFNKRFKEKFPDMKARKYDDLSVMAMKTEDGVLLPVTRVVEFKKNPSLHKCDARCTNAKGSKCECSCMGKNHGRGV